MIHTTDYTPLLSAYGIAYMSANGDAQRKKEQQALEDSLKYISNHISDDLDDSTTAAYLSMSGVDRPHIQKVVDVHQQNVRCNTIKRIARLWKNTCKQHAEFNEMPLQRQVSFDALTMLKTNTKSNLAKSILSSGNSPIGLKNILPTY